MNALQHVFTWVKQNDQERDAMNALQHVFTWVKQNDKEREDGMNTLQDITWVDVGVGRVLSGLDCHGLRFLTRGQVLDHQHQTTCTRCTTGHSPHPTLRHHAAVLMQLYPSLGNTVVWCHTVQCLFCYTFSFSIMQFCLLIPMWISLYTVETTLKTQQKWSHEGWSLVRVSLTQTCEGEAFKRGVFSHQGGLSSGWALNRVLFHWCGLSSGWSFTDMVFHQGGLSPMWSFIMMVFNQGFHCSYNCLDDHIFCWLPILPDHCSGPVESTHHSLTSFSSWPLVPAPR